MEPTGKYSTGDIFLAVIGGSLLGAITAILLAPKSGSDTRHQIAEYIDEAKHTISQVPKAIKSASHAAKETLSQKTLCYVKYCNGTIDNKYNMDVSINKIGINH